MSDSVRPHRRQPTRLPRPWDSPGKNTGVGCHFLLQCMKAKSESEVAQSCPALSDPVNCSLPGSSVHGIFQARVLEWVAIAYSQSHMKFVPKVKLSYEISCIIQALEDHSLIQGRKPLYKTALVWRGWVPYMREILPFSHHCSQKGEFEK